MEWVAVGGGSKSRVMVRLVPVGHGASTPDEEKQSPVAYKPLMGQRWRPHTEELGTIRHNSAPKAQLLASVNAREVSPEPAISPRDS